MDIVEVLALLLMLSTMELGQVSRGYYGDFGSTYPILL